jgi:hypothetical protein
VIRITVQDAIYQVGEIDAEEAPMNSSTMLFVYSGENTLHSALCTPRA